MGKKTRVSDDMECRPEVVATAGETQALSSLEVAQDVSSKVMEKCPGKHGHRCAGEGNCCGHGCKSTQGICCENFDGYLFSCGSNSRCCGNACMDDNSKCCRSMPDGYWFPLTKKTRVSDDMECRPEVLATAGETQALSSLEVAQDVSSKVMEKCPGKHGHR